MIRRTIAKKLWFPKHKFWIIPPRLKQLFKLASCHLRGHQFGPFMIDNYDGPMINMGGESVPAVMRPVLPGEQGTRVCKRRCGTMERLG